MEGGQAVQSNLELKDGVWTLTFSRELAASNPGDVAIEPGKTYMVGFAIHDDYTSARVPSCVPGLYPGTGFTGGRYQCGQKVR